MVIHRSAVYKLDSLRNHRLVLLLDDIATIMSNLSIALAVPIIAVMLVLVAIQD